MSSFRSPLFLVPAVVAAVALPLLGPILAILLVLFLVGFVVVAGVVAFIVWLIFRRWRPGQDFAWRGPSWSAPRQVDPDR
jgi:hypothetical protein